MGGLEGIKIKMEQVNIKQYPLRRDAEILLPPDLQVSADFVMSNNMRAPAEAFPALGLCMETIF